MACSTTTDEIQVAVTRDTKWNRRSHKMCSDAAHSERTLVHIYMAPSRPPFIYLHLRAGLTIPRQTYLPIFIGLRLRMSSIKPDASSQQPHPPPSPQRH